MAEKQKEAGSAGGVIRIRAGLNAFLLFTLQVLAWSTLWAASHIGILWAIPLGIVFSFFQLTNYALMHEAGHHVLTRSSSFNYMFGVLCASMFPKSFTLYEVAHHMHHRGNRTDHEMFDYYYPNDNMFIKNVQWYGILTGIYYPLIPLGSILIALAPWLFHTKMVKQAKTSQILFSDIRGKNVSKIRFEVLFIALYWFAMWKLLSLSIVGVLICYVCFAFNWATRQYVTHAWTKRDVVEGASNLKVSRLSGAILLNGQWDHVHHKFPFLPWSELTNTKYHEQTPVSYFRRWLSLWGGMRPNTEKAPEVITPDEYRRLLTVR